MENKQKLYNDRLAALTQRQAIIKEKLDDLQSYLDVTETEIDNLQYFLKEGVCSDS